MPLRFFHVMAAFFAFGLLSFMPSSSHAVELPDYKVIKSDGAFEIRDYPSLLIAEVTVSGDRGQAGGRSFRKLAGFIFGGNDNETSIKMTAPVVQTPQEDGRWVVNFMMPSKFNKSNLPRPNDEDIRIRETEPVQTVSLRFNGRAGEQSLKRRNKELMDYISAKGLEAVGEPYYAFYDAPMVPGPFRRNEVHMRLKPKL
jgi:hypothetical protein